MLKMLVVYVHLLSTCLALGSIGWADWRLWRNRHRAPTLDEIAGIAVTQTVVTIALAVLWGTGVLLVLLGYLAEPQSYLTNEKLWAKVSVVVILTVNGVLLHRVAFPKLTAGVAFIRMAERERLGLGVLGAVSSVSWMFASFLGIARPWNYTLSYPQVMMVYLAVLGAALLGVIGIARSRLALLPDGAAG